MIETILEIVKARLDILPADTSRDTYLKARIKATLGELARIGIHLEDCADDVVFAADYTCWRYSSREKSEPMPEWLKLARRERWLAERRCDDDT